jgi:hypothetical protein
MRFQIRIGIILLAAPAMAAGQEIVKVPASKAPTVSRPDDLFGLQPSQWHFAKQLSHGPDPCTVTECEAGYTAGDLVVSVEHAGEFVRVIAGYRSCEPVGYSEVEVGTKPGKPTFGRVRQQVERVLKGLSKTCKLPTPAVPSLDAAKLFPGR